MMLDSGLTRTELAVLLTRITVNLEHLQAEQGLYTQKCDFTDVPAWAKVYVGYCSFNGMMVGYGNHKFGAVDPVTPAAACTVILRYLGESDWNYSTACSKAVELGLAPEEITSQETVTRGDTAVLLYRALLADGNVGDDTQAESTAEKTGLTYNADGSINLPADGSQYIPQTGDVIRCDDGSNYSITDVSRWDENMFASGPVGALPEPTCDWSLLPQPELPAPETSHYSINGQEYLFVRNLYETRRMLYTLYNAIGNNPETWQNGAPVLHPSGSPKVTINLAIAEDLNPQVFWPWRESEIVNLFNSCPPGTYSMEAWDVYKDGVFQKTEYNIHVK
ncbi:MAG: S-layer homology domain-containing protein [Collinsella tanakaei]|nr:MAG: S-layer homology domain-containing protein [Collinsella tanakaei]